MRAQGGVWSWLVGAALLPTAGLQEPLRTPVSWALGNEGATLGVSAGMGAPGLCRACRLLAGHWQLLWPITAVLSRCCCKRSPAITWAVRCGSKSCLRSAP